MSEDMKLEGARVFLGRGLGLVHARGFALLSLKQRPVDYLPILLHERFFHGRKDL